MERFPSSPKGTLPPQLAEDRQRVEGALQSLRRAYLPRVPEPLRAAVGYAWEGPGKRLRPLLCIAAYRAVRGEAPDAVVELATALELVHTYSLVHDDLPCMDDDDLRRGRPTVHRVFGARVALLAGMALLPMAFDVLETAGQRLGLARHVRAGLRRELAWAAGPAGMVGGQWLDLAAEGRPVGLRQLVAIHRAKTGALLTASVRLGARAARAPRPVLQALTAYGRALGLAFQIVDDILGVTGSSEETGKPIGRDDARAKATYPRIFGLEGARARAREAAARALHALRRLDRSEPELIALVHLAVHRSR